MSSRETARLIFDRRKFNAEYQSYADKKKYYDAIAEGDVNRIAELSEENYQYPSRVFERSDSYSDAVYKLYYEGICAASEMCLVAIQNGLPDMVAYDIRDQYVAELDRAVSLPDLYDLIHGMAHEFAVRVKLSHTPAPISPYVTAMLSFIESNLYNQISLQDVADAADLSRTYACALFSKELGMTMNEWIMRERLAEARRLLSDRHLAIDAIANQLQFCSQSYFGLSFKRVYGITPGEYRRNPQSASL